MPTNLQLEKRIAELEQQDKGGGIILSNLGAIIIGTSSIVSVFAIGFSSFVLWNFDKEVEARITLDDRVNSLFTEFAENQQSTLSEISEISGHLSSVTQAIESMPGQVTLELDKSENPIGRRLASLERVVSTLPETLAESVTKLAESLNAEDNRLQEQIGNLNLSNTSLNQSIENLSGLDNQVEELTIVLRENRDRYYDLAKMRADISSVESQLGDTASNEVFISFQAEVNSKLLNLELEQTQINRRLPTVFSPLPK